MAGGENFNTKLIRPRHLADPYVMCQVARENYREGMRKRAKKFSENFQKKRGDRQVIGAPRHPPVLKGNVLLGPLSLSLSLCVSVLVNPLEKKLSYNKLDCVNTAIHLIHMAPLLLGLGCFDIPPNSPQC